MSTKPPSLATSSTVRYNGLYGGLHTLGQKQTGIPCENGVLRLAGADLVHGVVYRVTVEPIGATLGETPELHHHWGGGASMFHQPKYLAKMRRVAAGKGEFNTPEARQHARECLASHIAAQEAHKAACRYYAQMLALRQFPAVKDPS